MVKEYIDSPTQHQRPADFKGLDVSGAILSWCRPPSETQNRVTRGAGIHHNPRPNSPVSLAFSCDVGVGRRTYGMLTLWTVSHTSISMTNHLIPTSLGGDHGEIFSVSTSLSDEE